MGLTIVFDYPWAIENIVSHVVVVLRIFLEDVPKAWSQELEHGQKSHLSNQSYWDMPDSKLDASKL
jgi:hypothetical protein